MSDIENSIELERLLGHLFSAELSQADHDRLCSLLEADERLRERYLDYLDVHLGMLELAETGETFEAKPSRTTHQRHATSNRGPTPILISQRLLRPALAAMVVLSLVAGRWAYLEYKARIAPTPIVQTDDVTTRPEDRESSQEVTSSGIAIITSLVDVKFGEAMRPLEVGDALSPGLLNIESGFAQLEFFCGATVIVEGPAQLELESSMAARLKHGRLRARVPPAARGFAIDVSDMKVIDLGTEFGLSVTDGASAVQVFDGEVELQLTDQEKRRLTTGQAVTRTNDGMLDSASTPDDFTNIIDLESRADLQTQARYEDWKSYSRRLRQDPRLIVYYSFDSIDSWQRTLSNNAKPTRTELDGAIVGARRSIGRWSTKGALDFKQPGDRVRVQIPGEYGSLTFACWVKIDSLDRWYNSLFLTDNYQRGEPHWQILDTGQLFLSVRVSRQDGGPEHAEVLSKPFWNPSLSGKWLHLATSYDVDQRRTTHYLNGKPLSSETIPIEQLVPTTRFGTASIGNWSGPTKPDEHFAVRNLNGTIDEFALFAAALNEDEIAEMYQHGKP